MNADDEQRIVHWTIRVSGIVQGVNYRAEARRQAIRLGLGGSAANMPDGTVRIEVEGPVAALHRFRDWCATGPSLARVDRVELHEGEPRGYQPGDFVRR